MIYSSLLHNGNQCSVTCCSAGVTLTEGGELSAGDSVAASDGLISYYPEFSGFGDFRNGVLLYSDCLSSHFPLSLP